MPILIKDVESRSTLNLADAGAWRYAADASTEVLCVGYAVNDAPAQIWTPDQQIPEEVLAAARDPDWLVVAHNDQFESAIEERLLHPRYGWPIIPIERHRCTMAMALASALPASLEDAAEALGLPVRKDSEGHRLMLQMARPRKPRASEIPPGPYWHDDPDRRLRLQEYCKHDVELERLIYHRLPPLTAGEQKVWIHDAIVNRRGFYVDLQLAEAAREIVHQEEKAIDAEVTELTGGKITSINQVAKLSTLLREYGHDVADLNKQTVKTLLADAPEDIPRRLLELRQQGAHAAARKLNSLIAGIDVDQRMRGTFRYHGASTGRWSGNRFQPQNLKKAKAENLDAAVEAIRAGDLERLRQIGAPLAIVGDISRNLITAAPEHMLIGADLSAIESRVLAWLANEKWKLNAYRQFDETGDPKQEPYCVTASKILQREVTPTDEAGRAVGKVCDLAFGFGGGLSAWRRFDPSDTYTDKQVESFKAQWRTQHAATVRFGRALENTLRRALQTKERIVLGNLSAEVDNDTLYLTLPSGRRLAYPEARLVPGRYPGATQILFKDNGRGGWLEQRGWPGSFTENVTQAIARDVLAAAMLRLEAAGYPIVLTVHDEIVAEVPEGFGSTDDFLRLMTTPPAWATDLPIAAKAWIRTCYAKPQAPSVEKPAKPDNSETAQTNIVPLFEHHQSLSDNPKSRPSAAHRIREAAMNNENTTLSGANFLHDEYFAGTQGNIFLGCFRNADSKLPRGQIANLVTRVPEKMDRFVVSHDEPESQTAIYYCTSTLRNGHAGRTAEDCWEFVSLFADIDDANHNLSQPLVISLLDTLPYPPTLIISSGHGLQPHWLLVTPSEDAERIKALRKKLQGVVASDAVHDAPRLMRLPGSHNSKFGDWHPVEVVHRTGKRYTLDELEAWLTTAEVIIRPLPAKEEPSETTSSDDAGPIDVEARYAAMTYKGAGENAIHPTQLQCTASRLRSGWSVEDTVAEALEATQHAVVGDPQAANWNWNEEKFEVEKLCFDFINKNPELAPALPDYLFAARCDRVSAGEANPTIIHVAPLGWRISGTRGREASVVIATASAVTWPTPYSARPSSAIPRRKRLWGNHYLRGEVTITAAPGATGKSQHNLIEAVGMAAGRDLITGEVKKARLRVWVWNAEDDVDEQERRVAGICDHYGMDRETLRDWLFLDSGYAVPLEFASGGKVAIIKEGVLRAVADRVKALKLDVVIFDPLVALHTLPEGDNTNLAKVIRALGTQVAKPCNCAVELVHHTRKSGKGDDSALVADDMRGASTIVYTPRSGRLMHPMSGAEAEKYGVDGEDRLSYVRLERAKPNMAKRGTIYWVQLIVHTIDNAGEGEPADTVTVPTLWTPIDVTNKITDAISDSIRTTIAQGEFRRDARAGNDWAGRVVGKLCNLDLSQRSGRTQADAILASLITKGVLATDFRTDPKTRKTREYVVPGSPLA